MFAIFFAFLIAITGDMNDFVQNCHGLFNKLKFKQGIFKLEKWQTTVWKWPDQGYFVIIVS